MGIILTMLTAAVIVYVLASFQNDMAFAYGRISEGSNIIYTENGTLEYSDHGNGSPVLVVHGAGGGYDQGILLSQLFFGKNAEALRIIAPSRFGFLHTPMPVASGASFAAQADSFADMLEQLGIEKVTVVGFSAGGPSAIEFALRYPEKTMHLVLVSAVIHEEPPLQPSDDTVLNGLFKSDFAFWFLGKYMQPQLLSFLGVGPAVQESLTVEERTWISENFIPSLNPISLRQPGMLNDRINFISIDYPLERITAPTLVVNAKDDTLVSPSHSLYAADNIANSVHIQFENGGHVLMGQHKVTESTITEFLLRDNATRITASSH